jgi:hemin uptake protein HemP
MHSDAALPPPELHRKHALPAPVAREAATPADAHTRRLSSTELLGSARELEISHGDALYRLRLTSLGKLILTK